MHTHRQICVTSIYAYVFTQTCMFLHCYKLSRPVVQKPTFFSMKSLTPAAMKLKDILMSMGAVSVFTSVKQARSYYKTNWNNQHFNIIFLSKLYLVHFSFCRGHDFELHLEKSFTTTQLCNQAKI